MQLPGDVPKVVILDGGPLDGRSWTALYADELSVVMSDGQKHRYVRTVDTRTLADGSRAQVFDWAGRYFGPA